MKKILSVLILLGCVMTLSGQTWTFDNNTQNGWSTVRISATTGTSYLTLTTTGQNNPKFRNQSAGIDADSNTYAIVKMRVASGGPTLLRINFPNGNVKTSITTGTTGFVSYAINMTHNSWNGTINDIELAFKEDDGTTGGGTHSSSGVTIEIEEISFVDYIPSNQTVLYVDPSNGNNTSVGSSSAPLQSIPLALDIAAANSISNVYVKSGTYNFSSSIDITTQATSKVTLSPEPNGSVKLNLGGFRNFRFHQGAKNIEVKGFELDGRSNSVDHWTLLSQYVWQPDLLPDSLAGGGICFQIENAEDIFITNNVIHDFFQKAVNIEDGRYVQISGNVIYNIGHTSLSGGHGIMRQQGSGSFSTNDDPNKYRWDINGNLIFNVHQRIYSWVPSKGYLNMTLDEGKSILIDETPNHDTGMKARITNNVIAFGKIDAIRLKPTNGLEVSNNSIFSRDSHADGITNTTNGFNTSTYGTPFLNFIGKNNAVDVNAVTDAYKLDDAMASTGSSSSNNYAAYGDVVPTSVATYQNTDLFTDPDNGDFELLNTQLSNVGIPQSILDDLIARADTYNVTIANDHWQHDHLKNTQTLLDNIPGVEDGVAQNEPVFTDAGTYDASDLEFNKGRKAYYFTLNTTWKSDNISANSVLNRGNGLSAYDGKYELVVPEAYSDWLDSAKTDFLRDADGDGVGETAYSRIRYGASVIAQNKVFPAHTLQYISIDGDTTFTQTTANDHRLELNGLDLYVKVNYNPSSAQTYDLIVADSIQGVVGTVILDGYSGPYNTGVFNVNGKQVLRLVLGATTFSGTNYYISGSGDDTNDGLSLTTPFETIDHAISQLSPGDTLNFITGTYTHSTYGDGDWFKTQNKTTVFINNVHGAANAYITFRPAPNQNVKIKGDGVAAIEVKASSYIRIEGFEVEGDVNIIPLDTARKYQFLYRDPQGLDQFRFPPGTSAAVVASTTNLPVLSSSYKRPTYFNVAGISVKNSNHIDVIDNYVHHMPGEGIKSFDSDYLLISGNKVHDCSRRSSHGVHGLSVYTLSSIDSNTGYKVIIENNEVFDNYNEVYSWNQTKTFVNPHYDEGKGITIQRCYPATGWTSGRILIRNNVAYRNGLSGIQVNSGERIDIYHNTVYGNHRTTEMYGDGAQHGVSIQSGDDINFKNNIAQSWSNAQGSKVYKVSANSTNITASNNLLIGGSDASTNVLSSSPEFVDSTNYDFRLSSTSPAVDAGTSVGVTTDFLGKTRDSSPDYGAHEWSTLNCVANTGTDIISACDSYTWIDGVTYTSSNSSATHTLTNVDGCDSVVTLNLTINNNTGTDNITASGCYTWIDGVTYTASNNTATHTLTNQYGCDSVVSLNLTISSSGSSTTMPMHSVAYLIPTNTATHVAVNDGSWFSTSTWNTGTVPSDAAIVHIPSDKTVTYEGSSTAHIFAIRVDGTLLIKQTNSTSTTDLTVDTFIGTMSSKIKVHANGVNDGKINIVFSPFDIEGHKSGNSGYSQSWNSNATSHYSDGATHYHVEYSVGPDKRFNTYAEALLGNTSVTETKRVSVDDDEGVLGRYGWDSTQVSLGLVTMGEIEILGQEKDNMIALAADATSGSNTLSLASAPSGWLPGDELIITRGGAQGTNNPGEDQRTISSVSGTTITLSANLSKNHWNQPADTLYCYVGNLTRNITFSSSSADSTLRGHFMAMHNDANVQVKNAAFYDMGRTDKSKLLNDYVFKNWKEPVVFKSKVSALGQECVEMKRNAKDDISNMRGRYSIHLHKLGATASSNLAVVTGNVIWGNPGWGITHHDSYADISDNVLYDITGAGIVSEAGSETGVWNHNLLVKISKGHTFDFYESALWYDDYLFTGQGLGMKGRAVVCNDNVIANANIGVGVMNISPSVENMVRADPLALAQRPEHPVNHWPLSTNGYSKEGDGVLPLEPALIVNNTTAIWCYQGLRSFERDMGLNHESRSVFEGFKCWGINEGLSITYQADYTFKNVYISGKNMNAVGIFMWKHSHNQVYENIKLEDLGYGITCSKLVEKNGTKKTRNNGFTPWYFIDLTVDNVTDLYEITTENANSTTVYDEHGDNTIHLSSSDFVSRPTTFTILDSSELVVDYATGDLQFKVDGIITDQLGSYDIGVQQAWAQGDLRLGYPERIYEFASTAKLDEYVAANGVYEDTATNEKYFLITEFLPDRRSIEYTGFPIYVKILNAPSTGAYASPQVLNLEPESHIISRLATVSQSSTDQNITHNGNAIDAGPQKSIDGNTNGRINVQEYQSGLVPIGSFSQTTVETEPWFDVDLGENKLIEYIDIWSFVNINGSDMETLDNEFKNFYVFISDTAFGTSGLTDAQALADYSFYKDNTLQRKFSINNVGAIGRYVRIQGAGTRMLRLSEIEIIGSANPCPPTYGTDVITACGSYTWIDGNTYTASNNTATYTLTNAAGCDSIVTLDLTINSSNTGTDVVTACGSYTWIDGLTYTASNNTATHTLTNVDGCDSVVTLNLVIISNSPSAPLLSNPANGVTNISLSPTLNWTSSTTNGTYELSISTDASFNTIVTSQTGLTGNSFTASNLLPNTTYYWRVGVSNICASTVYSNIYSFTTTSCVEYNSTNIPVSIPSSGTPTVTSTLVISNSGTISDIDVINLAGEHTYISDLTVTLTSPAGTQVTLFSSVCTSEEDFDINFDDEASSSTLPCPPTGGGTYIPSQSLSAFDGENIQGTWTLTISDAYDLDGGSLDSWGLDICLTSSCDNASIMNVAACGSYTWIDGNTYTASNNTATYTLTNDAGCDSVVTLNLTINSSNTGTDVITACDSYTWIDGNTYTASNNTATHILTNAAGCDSVVTLNLTINSSNTGMDVITACDSYTWIDGNTYTASNNTATYTLTNASGCDSVVTLNLTINSSNTGTDVITACDSYTWIDGNTYTASNNTATYTLTNASGCDSVVTLNLTINSSNTGTDVIAACDSYTWIDGNTYTASNNTATHTLTNAAGCDSVVTLNLIINSSNTGTDVITACDSYTWIDGVTYTTSNNTATHTLTNAAGCDSVVTLNLTINSSNTGTDVITACDSYTWIDGLTYTASNNTATHTLTNVNGCDSVVTLNLTINSSNTGTDVITACDSYTWIDGNTYTASNNTATHTLTNVNGCDSVVTLNLTINLSNTGTDVITACDSYTWIDGNIYTASNNTATYTLTNAAGCDSVVTLDLTINSSNTGTDVITACDSYTWIDGNTYTASNNTATYTLTNAAGCDSVVTLNLTINSSNTGTDVITACDSYTWIDGLTYTASNNTATYTLTNAAGCDSVVTLNLTITALNTGVTRFGTIIRAVKGYDSYQWFECTSSGLAALPNEINDSLIISANGSYAVVVGELNCLDTSNCILVNDIGINEESANIFISPNPSKGEFKIKLNGTQGSIELRLVDSYGRLVHIQNIEEYLSPIQVNIGHLPSGAYYLIVGTSSHIFRESIVIQQ